MFDDDVDLGMTELKVWMEGNYLGRVGTGQRAEFERFAWRSPTRIGSRIETGRPTLPLCWVEIKGRMIQGLWVYHLVPRMRPPT